MIPMLDRALKVERVARTIGPSEDSLIDTCHASVPCDSSNRNPAAFTPETIDSVNSHGSAANVGGVLLPEYESDCGSVASNTVAR